MTGHVNELLEMAEWLKSAGEPDLARECVETANRFLDFFAFMDYCNRQRGAFYYPEPCEKWKETTKEKNK